MALVDANEAILVDVSAAEDYAATHIENAINIPFVEFEIFL